MEKKELKKKIKVFKPADFYKRFFNCTTEATNRIRIGEKKIM